MPDKFNLSALINKEDSNLDNLLSMQGDIGVGLKHAEKTALSALSGLKEEGPKFLGKAHDLLFPTIKHTKRMGEIADQLRRTEDPEEREFLFKELEFEKDIATKENIKQGILAVDVALPLPGKGAILKGASAGLINLIAQASRGIVQDKKLPTKKESIINFAIGFGFVTSIPFGQKLFRQVSEDFAKTGNFKSIMKRINDDLDKDSITIAEELLDIRNLKGGVPVEELEFITPNVQRSVSAQNQLKGLRIKTSNVSPEAADIITKQAAEAINTKAFQISRRGGDALKEIGISPSKETKRIIQVNEQEIELTTRIKTEFARGDRRKVGQIIADMIQQSDEFLNNIRPLLKEAGLDEVNFAKDYLKTLTGSARFMAFNSRFKREIEKHFKGTEAGRALEEMGLKTSDPGIAAGISDGLRKLDRASRSTIVSQPVTALRNAYVTTTVVGPLEIYKTFTAGILNKMSGKDYGTLGKELGSQIAILSGKMTDIQKRRFTLMLGTLPETRLFRRQLFGTSVMEVTVTGAYTKTMLTFNTAQEMLGRDIAYQMRLARNLARTGRDPFNFVPSKIPRDEMVGMVEDAVDFGLRSTFAKPLNELGSLGKFIHRAFELIPPLTLVNPFPRFFGNAFSFLYHWSPAGMIRLISEKNRNMILKGNADIIAESLMGTAMFATALALRANPSTRGPNTYDLKVGDETIDTRPFSPLLAPYMFFAEAFLAGLKKFDDSIPPEIGNISIGDFRWLILGTNRIAGTGLVFTQWFQGGAGSFMNQMKQFAGQYAGRFTVPLKPFKDILASVNPDEAIIRNTRIDPFIAPIQANIPILSQKLDPLFTPFQEGTIRTQAPLKRQATGITARPAQELRELAAKYDLRYRNIFPQTGMAKADNELSRRMGEIQAEFPLNTELLESQSYAISRYLLSEYFSFLRDGARELFKVEEPELYEEVYIKRIPEIKKGVLEEAGVNLQ